MVSHEYDHNVHATIIYLECKSDIGFTNPFLEDVIPQKMDGGNAYPSSDDARDLGFLNSNNDNTKKIPKRIPESSQQIPMSAPFMQSCSKLSTRLTL